MPFLLRKIPPASSPRPIYWGFAPGPNWGTFVPGQGPLCVESKKFLILFITMSMAVRVTSPPDAALAGGRVKCTDPSPPV